MPPKKKGSKSPGGKKKKSLSRKRGGSVKVKAQLNDADCALPQISNNRNQAIIGAVASSDVKSLSRMVTHYHYDDVINAPGINYGIGIISDQMHKYIPVYNNDCSIVQYMYRDQCK
jgi:hypothetical protein